MMVRAMLMVEPGEKGMIVTGWEIEGNGGQPEFSSASATQLREWLRHGWRFAPLTYYTTLYGTTVVCLEREDGCARRG